MQSSSVKKIEYLFSGGIDADKVPEVHSAKDPVSGASLAVTLRSAPSLLALTSLLLLPLARLH